ncbi:dihydrodipicolinate synthase [Ureibacillus massiliensis 4400831 = CIP 108448 = CCUG 49529]|uniref:4-hydroxy-tetrahydrodipicolinate synthase n=1 Tax=Ureibacillus massiliensis 4400831 = CIP 108448 = CCUG 49529 TaxID=1211035 RepID=A0A0A3J7M7_9BACL|nr:4-hydroxy-tetrahydrodipicolinate synthase [Ureibacillus massiliensis]KGR91178.1 dihydrodipicolinate synthase [Ureibacillus massiliensis 4400831 = CIP 108448 = CCUG 49529]
MDLGRIATAMVTPFTENGQIDYDVLEQIIEYLIANGTDTIVVCGTTGEAPTLSTEEKLQLIEFTVKKVNKRVPVVAGTGDNETHYSIEMTKKAEALGADAAMLVAPYYNKPNQRGLYEHFAAIAKETTLPLIVYNVPGRTGVNVAAKTTIDLSKIPNIQIVKEASGNLDQMTDILANVSKDFYVYSGDDGLTLPLLAIGGRGVISVAAHVVGNEMQAMIRAFEEGRHADAAEIHQALLPLIRELFSSPNPVPIKYAMSKVGFSIDKVRLPLVALDNEEKSSFDRVWNEFQEKAKCFKTHS